MEVRLEFIKLRKYLLTSLILVILALTWGCGSSGVTTPNAVVSKSASVTIIPSGGGEYVINGENMDGVEGIELIISYDTSTLSSSTVAQGGLISGASMISNTATPGIIKIALVLEYPKVLSGSGQIATFSFASVTGTESVSIASVKLLDINGEPIK
jgi:hypothetical protein